MTRLRFRITLLKGAKTGETFYSEDAPEWREGGRVLSFRGSWPPSTPIGDRNFVISLGDQDTVIVDSEEVLT